jgi:hypothetical protein
LLVPLGATCKLATDPIDERPTQFDHFNVGDSGQEIDDIGRDAQADDKILVVRPLVLKEGDAILGNIDAADTAKCSPIRQLVVNGFRDDLLHTKGMSD